MNKPTWKRQATRRIDSRARFRISDLGGLHSLMEARGFTSGYQLARESGLSPSTVNHIVHGRRRSASGATVRALREALGESIDRLFVLDKSTASVHPEPR